MNADFIKGLIDRLTSLFEGNHSTPPLKQVKEQPDLILRNPGPVVYLYKSDAYYKLGRTKDVHKRDKQIKLQLPFRAVQIHIIHTDDEVWLEKYWHREFAKKRRNGEWFELDASDVSRFCSHDEMLKPLGFAQTQLEFQEDESQPTVVSVRNSAPVIEQGSYETVFVQEVESYYQNLIALHPKRARSLEGSWSYQIVSMNSEVSRLQKERGYSELQALQEWKRKALMAADAKARPQS